jgi:hypothetical protein
VIGGEFAGDVVIAQPVKAVAAHALVVEAAGQREGVVDPGVAAVEGGVETGHLHGVGEGRDGGATPGEVVGLVQRRERGERVETRDQVGVMRAGASRSGPPWTTRWPMPAMGSARDVGAERSRIARGPRRGRGRR